MSERPTSPHHEVFDLESRHLAGQPVGAQEAWTYTPPAPEPTPYEQARAEADAFRATLSGESRPAQGGDPEASYDRAVADAEAYKGRVGTSSEFPAPTPEEILAQGRRDIYSKAYLKHAKHIAEAARNNKGGRIHLHGEQQGGWDAVHEHASYAAGQELKAHDDMVERDAGFAEAKRDADWDEMVRIMDEAYMVAKKGEAARAGDDSYGDTEKRKNWGEFNSYADKLSPKMQKKYLEHLDALDAASGRPKTPEPAPTPESAPKPDVPPAPAPRPDPSVRRPRPAGERTDRDQGNGNGRAVGRARVHYPQPRQRRGRPNDQAHRGPIIVDAKGKDKLKPKRPEIPDIDPRNTWRRRMPNMIELANSEIERYRGGGLKERARVLGRRLGRRGLRMAGFTEVPGGDSIYDPRVAEYYRTARYGIDTSKAAQDRSDALRTASQERLARSPERAPSRGETADAEVLEMISRLNPQGRYESNIDYNTRIGEELRGRRRYWRNEARRHPLAPDFSIDRYAAEILDQFARDADQFDQVAGHDVPADQLIGSIQEAFGLDRREADAVARGMATWGIFSTRREKDGTLYYNYKPVSNTRPSGRVRARQARAA